jgi:hypothetical protein
VLRAGRIQGEGSIVLGDQTKFEPILFGTSLTLDEKVRKLQPTLRVKGVKTSKKNKSSNTTRASSPTPKKNSFYVALLLLEFKDDL